MGVSPRFWRGGRTVSFTATSMPICSKPPLRPRARHAWYTRVELVTKDILGAGGRHPHGFDHFHPMSRVGAFTAGYVYDAVVSRAGRFGLGGDATVYYVPPNLKGNYGAPASFHVFLRYQPNRNAVHSAH